MTNLLQLHTEALNRQMAIGRRLQEIAVETEQLKQELFKTAGKIDMLEELMRPEPKTFPDKSLEEIFKDGQ